VIISDGENHEGGVAEACNKAADKGIKIYTVGMGLGQGVRIPAAGNTAYARDYRRDNEGNFVITRLNEPMLKEIANEGNGKYYHASSPDLGLNSMLAELNRMNKAGLEYTEYSEFEERFPGMVWLTLGLLIMEFVILGKKSKWFRRIKMFENSKGDL
jgi:Ca-activated chloride channel family protein